jgi:type I restriction enzyme S subunit
MNFPRYPNYKDSDVEWLGEVPEHWQHASLRHVCRRITDGSHFSPKSTDDGKFYVTVRNLSCGRIDLLGAAKISSEDFEQLEKAGCRPSINDVLFSKDGTVGKVAIVDDDNFVVLSSLAIISPRYDRLVSKFLFYFLQSQNGEKQIESLYAGAALRRITLDAIVGIWLPLPGLLEQQTIVAFLDRETAKIDALIAEQQRLIELLKEKRQAAISHAVTKGLNPDAPMKDSGIEWLGEVPAHWEVKRLKNISPQVTVGIVVEPSKYYVDDGIPALRSLNIQPCSITLDHLVYISPESNELLSKSRLNAGDLVAVRSGQPGTTTVVPSELEGCNCIDLIIIRKPLGGSEYFLCWYLNSDSAVHQFSEGSGGAIQQHFNIGTAMNLVIPMPPNHEQDEIATILDRETVKLDALTAEANRAITLLQERRAALISAAVTGKIDVRGLANRKAA